MKKPSKIQKLFFYGFLAVSLEFVGKISPSLAQLSDTQLSDTQLSDTQPLSNNNAANSNAASSVDDIAETSEANVSEAEILLQRERIEQSLNVLMQMLGETEDLDTADLTEITQQLDVLTQELNQLDIEALNASHETAEKPSEASSPSHLAYIESYKENLTTCTPSVYVDLLMQGMTESIRGWVGNRCQVDQQVASNGTQTNSRCFYTRQDIAIITAPDIDGLEPSYPDSAPLTIECYSR